MQLRWILLTLVCASMLVVGQILFKRAAAQWNVDGPTMTAVTTFFSPAMICALGVYALTTVLWVFILHHVPLSLAMPINALVFVATPLAAHWIFNEPLTPNALFGGALIVVGVMIAVR